MMPRKWDKEADMVIVGTGFAGLTAALTGRELGMSVLLLEKMPVPGGNSIMKNERFMECITRPYSKAWPH